MIDPAVAREFLSCHRLAVVGASADPKNFGTTIYKELKGRGYDVAAINPGAETVDGDRCYPDAAALPSPVEGAIVMVPRARAAGVVEACLGAGVPRIWLFQGIGGTGSASEEAIQLCRDKGVPVVAGACPFMFLEPAGWFHRAHRMVRRAKGAVGKETRPAPAATG